MFACQCPITSLRLHFITVENHILILEESAPLTTGLCHSYEDTLSQKMKKVVVSSSAK